MPSKIESGHGLIFLSQILEPQAKTNISKSSLEKVSKSFIEWGFNFVLPVVCLADVEDKYQLLTGLPIYEAAKKAGLKQIWVFLIGEKLQEAEKVIEQVQLQSSLNETLIQREDLEAFRKFLNDERSSLTTIPGIKDGYAKLIKSKRPFSSTEEMQKSLGAKRCINWFRAYKKISTSS